MKERIKELAKQADPDYTGNGDDIDMGDSLVGNHAIEKFAELIVKECTYQCYCIGEDGLAHELSEYFGFKFDFKKMVEDEE